MKKHKQILLAAAVSCIAMSANAGNFDGGKPLLCAMMETTECLPGAGCEAVKPESINLPTFLNVNFKKKLITEPGAKKSDKKKQRKAEIKRIEKIAGLTVLQGAQNGRGWTMSINQANGKMTISAAGDQAAFVVQGACTPR